jgi:hypothetical protein
MDRRFRASSRQRPALEKTCPSWTSRSVHYGRSQKSGRFAPAASQHRGRAQLHYARNGGAAREDKKSTSVGWALLVMFRFRWRGPRIRLRDALYGTARCGIRSERLELATSNDGSSSPIVVVYQSRIETRPSNPRIHSMESLSC